MSAISARRPIGDGITTLDRMQAVHQEPRLGFTTKSWVQLLKFRESYPAIRYSYPLKFWHSNTSAWKSPVLNGKSWSFTTCHLTFGKYIAIFLSKNNNSKIGSTLSMMLWHPGWHFPINGEVQQILFWAKGKSQVWEAKVAGFCYSMAKADN